MWLGHPDTRNIRILFSFTATTVISYVVQSLAFWCVWNLPQGKFLIQLALFSQDSLQVLPLLLMFLFFLWFINLQENILNWLNRQKLLFTLCSLSISHFFKKYGLEENNPSNYIYTSSCIKIIIIIIIKHRKDYILNNPIILKILGEKRELNFKLLVHTPSTLHDKTVKWVRKKMKLLITHLVLSALISLATYVTQNYLKGNYLRLILFYPTYV